MLLVHVTAYWLGVTLIVYRIARSPQGRVLGILLLGFFPPSFGTLAMIWVDVGMMAFLLLAIGLLLWLEEPEASRWLVVPTGLTLVYGASVRHNALAAVLPLLWLCARILILPARGGRARLRPQLRTALLAIGLAAVFFAASQAINRFQSEPTRGWAATLVWDLAAMSIAEQRVLIPESALLDLGGDDPLERVQRAFSPTNNSRLLWGEHRIASFKSSDIEALSRTPLYQPWVYVLASCLVLIASFRVRSRRSSAARWVAASGLLYSAPLLVIAPSAEFRYSVWLIVATVVAGALLLLSARSDRPESLA